MKKSKMNRTLLASVIARDGKNDCWLTKEDASNLSKDYAVRQLKDEQFHPTVPKFLYEVKNKMS